MSILTIQKLEVTQTRIVGQIEFASKLRDLGYINKFYIYEDAHNLRARDLDRIQAELKIYVDILLELLEAPILVDGVPETPDNGKRKKVRKVLQSIDVELYDFYEANLLQASNLANILFLVNEIQKEHKILSKKTMQKWEELRYLFNGNKWITKIPEVLRAVRFKILKRTYGKRKRFVESGLEPFMYKRMNNRKKLEYALEFRKYLEGVLLEILSAYAH